MLLGKRILVVAALLLFSAAAASPAQAAPGPCYPVVCETTVSSSASTLVPRQTFTLTAEKFAAGSTVTFSLSTSPTPTNLGTATASGAPDYQAVLAATLPLGTQSGSYTITASGTRAGGGAAAPTTNVTVEVAPLAMAKYPTTAKKNTDVELIARTFEGGSTVTFRMAKVTNEVEAAPSWSATVVADATTGVASTSAATMPNDAGTFRLWAEGTDTDGAANESTPKVTVNLVNSGSTVYYIAASSAGEATVAGIALDRGSRPSGADGAGRSLGLDRGALALATGGGLLALAATQRRRRHAH